MSILVLDTSVTLSWCFQDETNPYADKVLDAIAPAGALVPPIWPLEVVNVLVQAERLKRLTRAATAAFLGLLRQLPIVIEAEGTSKVFDSVLPLARASRLSAYDAAYLEQAMRSGLPLATLDRRLQKAAADIGIKLFS